MDIYGKIPSNPPARRFTRQQLEGALDEIIAGRTNFNTPGRGPRNQSAQNARPASGNSPWQQRNGWRLGQPIQDDILELPDAPNTQSASSDRPVSGRRPRQRTHNPKSLQPTVEDDLELPDAPDTLSASGGRPASGRRPRERKNNPRSRQLTVEDDLELPDASDTLSASGGSPASGRRPRERKHNPRSRQPTVEDDLELPDAPNTQSAFVVRPASGGMPWQRTNSSRSNRPMLEDGLGLPKHPQATPFGQSPWNPAPADETQNVPLRSFPWAGPVRPARQNDTAMAEAPPASVPTGPKSDVRPAPNSIPASATQSGPEFPHGRANQSKMPVPSGPRSDLRPAPSSIPASATKSVSAFPHGIANQSTMSVPTGPRSDLRPAPSFTPTSAPQSGPAIPLGRGNQPGMPIPSGPRSSMAHVMNNQSRASVPDPSASRVRPPRPPYPAATPSSPFQAPKPLPASATPSSPASLDPRRWPGTEARAQNIDSAHSSNPGSRSQSNSSIFHDSVTVEAPSRPASLPQERRSGHEQVSASNSGPAHNLPRDAARQSHSSTFSVKVSDPHAVHRSLDETRRTSTPDGASSTRIPQSHPAQSFAQAPPSQTAQASQKASHSSFFSSQSDQIPGLSSEPDLTQASLSQRKFKIIRMRLVEDAVTLRSGYALFWV